MTAQFASTPDFARLYAEAFGPFSDFDRTILQLATRKLTRRSSVLCFGAGTGRFYFEIARLSKAYCAYVEPDSHMRAILERQRPDHRGRLGLAGPTRARGFHLIFLGTDVLSYLAPRDANACLRTIAQSLSFGGMAAGRRGEARAGSARLQNLDRVRERRRNHLRGLEPHFGMART